TGVESLIRDSTPVSLVEIIEFNLLDNHYHLILNQLVENGISKFMHRLSIGYTLYFNKKYNRSGHLFQGRYKIKHLNFDEYYTWCRLYVRYNHVIHDLKSSKGHIYTSLVNRNIVTASPLPINRLEIKDVIAEAKDRKRYGKYALENL
ncbi:MAG: transposase, partial [Candidatus Komeilibacteria bacterium]|nr:transposase [Candidatus Komeilibacteria bacterium]